MKLSMNIRKSFPYQLWKLCEAILANIVYWRPSRGIKCIWVTWTDGKTTTNELIYHILKQSNKKVWIMSTISMDLWTWKMWNISKDKLTSLTHREFNKFMRKAKQNGIEYMVVEPSSHAIHQYRFWPAKFVAVWITNLTHEHLDFHGNMQHYFNTKAKMFSKWLYKHSFGIMPKSFEYWEELKWKSKVDKLLTFSKDDKAEISATNIREHPELEFDLIFNESEFNKWYPNDSEAESILHVSSKFSWLFNIDNILIASGICKHLCLSNKQIVQWIKSCSPLPWRVEIIKTHDSITIVVDFALTPNALTQLYTSFKKLDYNRQIAVFGATWNRDKKKRPIMWKIATELNDFVIITEDENYDEDGMKIMEQIESWIDKQYANKYKLVQNRKIAISEAIKMAWAWDVILLTWMWNFTNRAMGENKIPWDEKAVVLAELEKLSKKISK